MHTSLAMECSDEMVRFDMNKPLRDEVLDLGPPRLSAEVIRSLTPSDLLKLKDPKGSKPSPVLRFRDSHHRLARCIALGFSDVRISGMTGYSQSRISILKSDPAFQDLIEVYRQSPISDHEDVMSVEHEVKSKAQLVKLHYLDQTLEKVDKALPVEPADVRLAMDMSSDMEDRIGHVKRTVSANINVDFAGRLESARRRSGLLSPPEEPSDE